MAPEGVSLSEPHPAKDLADSMADLSMAESDLDARQKPDAAGEEAQAAEEAEGDVARPKTHGTVKWFSGSKGEFGDMGGAGERCRGPGVAREGRVTGVAADRPSVQLGGAGASGC